VRFCLEVANTTALFASQEQNLSDIHTKQTPNYIHIYNVRKYFKQLEVIEDTRHVDNMQTPLQLLGHAYESTQMIEVMGMNNQHINGQRINT